MKRPTWWLLLMGATGLTACDPLTTLPSPPGAAAPIVAPERPAPLAGAPAEAPAAAAPEPAPAPAAEPLPEPAAETEMRWWSFDDWRDYWDSDDDEDDEQRKKKRRKDG